MSILAWLHPVITVPVIADPVTADTRARVAAVWGARTERSAHDHELRQFHRLYGQASATIGAQRDTIARLRAERDDWRTSHEDQARELAALHARAFGAPIARTGLLVPARADRPPRTITWSGDALLAVLHREIACTTVDALTVPAEHAPAGIDGHHLTAWVDDEARLHPIRPAMNERVMRLLGIDRGQPLLGNVVLTGGTDDDGDTLGLADTVVEQLLDALLAVPT